MKKISTIFPVGYLNPPTEAQVRAEILRWIQSVHNIPLDLLEHLDRIECPYQLEAYALLLDDVCTELETDFDTRLGCVYDNCYMPYWPRRHETIRRIVRRARDEQAELADDETKPQKPITPVAAAKLIQEQKKASKTAQPTNTTINMTINNYGGTQNIFEAGATQHIERLICTSAPQEETTNEKDLFLNHESNMEEIDNLRRDTERISEREGEAQSALCTYIIPNDIKPMEEIEQEMLAAARKNAPALANYIRHALRLGLIDLRGDDGITIFENLREHFGLTYKYRNWATYYG